MCCQGSQVGQYLLSLNGPSGLIGRSGRVLLLKDHQAVRPHDGVDLKRRHPLFSLVVLGLQLPARVT